MRAATTAFWCLLLSGPSLFGQEVPPADGGVTHSLGQPRVWKGTAGAATGWLVRNRDARTVTEARFGLFRDLLNPVIGVAGLHVEGYAGARDTRIDGGARIRFVSPFARFAVGADHNLVDHRTKLLLSVFNSGRRGGLFGDGSILRLDYIPGREHYVALGIEKPVGRRIPMGRTRPQHDHARLAAAPLPLPRPPAAAADALAAVADAASSIRHLVTPYLDQDGPNRLVAQDRTLAAFREMRGTVLKSANAGTSALAAEVRRYHGELEQAFRLAMREGATGDATVPPSDVVAAKALEVLLTEVLLPWNRLLGQRKEADTTWEFARRALAVFERWVHVSGAVPASSMRGVTAVFASLLGIVEDNRAAARAEWGDSRFVWLPLQFALRPDQHDTQGELDALIATATGNAFTEGNHVSYVINEQFQYQLSRTIRAARDYHVLWTHDFRGLDARGTPDEMAFRHVLRSYLAALTERVREYDRTGRLPVYLILIDQWFYEVNKGRLWLSLLEDPTRHELDLPEPFTPWADSLAAAQRDLRDAIASSSLLHSQRQLHGDAWLRQLVKVHVNVTNPGDPSFWSWGVARFVSLPDNIMRDHRKVAFYDLTEEDPYRGEALYTGAGIGEHYANLSWEDRSLLVRGPAALGLKTAARELLLTQGVRPDRMPWPLRERRRPPDYEARIRAASDGGQRTLRAVEIHNGTGFADKRINVAKAILYTLMPPGSVIKIPDSLWNDPFWGSSLLGAALRGVRVLIIAPSFANAPARAFGSMARSNELLWRLVAAAREFEHELLEAGGLLKVGLYASQLTVTDIPGKIAAVRGTLAREAWLRDLFGFAPSVYTDLDDLAQTLQSLSMTPDPVSEFEYDPRPMLHLKANFFASAEAWTLMSRPEWVAMTWEFVQQRIAQVQTRTAAVRSFEEYPDALIDVGGGVVQEWYEALDPAARERAIFFTMIGSQNQNTRSLVVDGEVAFVVANWPSVIPWLDLISLIGQCRWVTDPAEVDALLPPQGEFKRGLARRFKLQF